MRGPRFLTLFAFAAAIPMAQGAPPAVTVASYNLENFVGTEPQPGSVRPAAPKTEAAVGAVVRIVQEIAPDVLGVCEMGSRAQLARLQERLAAGGLNLTESEYVEGPDAVRHLALLSRFPIVERHSEPDVAFELNGAPHKVERGFLDVTVRINPGYELRLIGVHLKSRLPVPEGEALIRRHEAALLRRHVETVLAAAPETNLLVYGDCNDYRNEAPIQSIAGARGAPFHLTELAAVDTAGERWTHYWKTADVYSRIDYFFAAPALLPELAGPAHIYRGEGWQEASDHRAIYCSIAATNLRR